MFAEENPLDPATRSRNRRLAWLLVAVVVGVVVFSLLYLQKFGLNLERSVYH